jgi:hypothetical protein
MGVYPAGGYLRMEGTNPSGKSEAKRENASAFKAYSQV